MSGKTLLWTTAIPIILVLANTGCATKKYANQQAGKVNQRVSQVEKKSNEQIAYLNNKLDTDISQTNERVSTVDLKVNQVATSAQQANSTASQALDQTEANKAMISQNSTEITTLASGVANAMNYQLVEKGNITFAFNKSELTPASKLALDQIAQKAQALPRAVVELTGFTDKIGSQSYNLALSRRRAESVQRYLVRQKVPVRSIHIVGLGEEPPPPDLEADLQAINPNADKQELNRLARRVVIRVYGAGDITAGTASRAEQ